jgi:Na+-translocating ferredoxin:NAD+ oxidoreductase RnfE subunit
MLPVDLRRSALLICGDLREILFPGLLMQDSRCFTQIYANLARRFAQIMLHVDLRRSALLICGDLREILFPGLLMQDSRYFTQIYADIFPSWSALVSRKILFFKFVDNAFD